MRQLFFIFLLGLLCFSCKNESSVSSSESNNLPTEIGPPVDPKTLKMPSTCSLISAADVKSIFNAKSDVNVKDASDEKEKNSRACFFRWDDPATPNAGIMIQLQTNSVFEDYPEYIANYIPNKISNGEMTMESDTPIKYSKFDANGRNGAYSFQQGRFYWAMDNNYIIALYFNVSTLNEKSMVKAAEKIIAKVNSNFVKAVY